jgi:hypothetical protein
MGGFTPTDVANEALDSVGWPNVLGDIEDGSEQGAILLRKYRQCLMQLLRSANWDFARKTVPLTLLADATGNTPNVGTAVPIPWIYEYAYPTDCMKVRFVPFNYANQADMTPANNIQIPQTPLLTGVGTQALIGTRLRPSRFVIATDFNYPPPQGQQTWDIQGISPQGRTVVLSNVRMASVVYTALVLYPSVWDSLFRAAFVAYLASEVAMPLWTKTDRKFGLQMRGEQINIVRAKVQEARLVDGNEGFYSSDIPVDWMQSRRVGGGWTGRNGGLGGNNDGVWGYGNDMCSFADGTAY